MVGNQLEDDEPNLYEWEKWLPGWLVSASPSMFQHLHPFQDWVAFRLPRIYDELVFFQCTQMQSCYLWMKITRFGITSITSVNSHPFDWGCWYTSHRYDRSFKKHLVFPQTYLLLLNYISGQIIATSHDLTPKGSWGLTKGNPLILGKSRLVKYCNLVRYLFVIYTVIYLYTFQGLQFQSFLESQVYVFGRSILSWKFVDWAKSVNCEGRKWSNAWRLQGYVGTWNPIRGCLGGGFKHFLFLLLFGEDSHFD